MVRRAGPNTYNDAIGPYFKFGLCAPGGWTPGVSRTIYFDGIRALQGLRAASHEGASGDV